MKKYQSKMKGEYFVDAAKSAEDFGTQLENGEHTPWLVDSGIYRKADNEAESIIKCDFPDSKEYLKGYCYPDTKFFGKYHYSVTSGRKPVELRGIFIEHDDCIQLFGEEHDEDGMRYFCLILYFND